MSEDLTWDTMGEAERRGRSKGWKREGKRRWAGRRRSDVSFSSFYSLSSMHATERVCIITSGADVSFHRDELKVKISVFCSHTHTLTPFFFWWGGGRIGGRTHTCPGRSCYLAKRSLGRQGCHGITCPQTHTYTHTSTSALSPSHFPSHAHQSRVWLHVLKWSGLKCQDDWSSQSVIVRTVYFWLCVGLCGVNMNTGAALLNSSLNLLFPLAFSQWIRCGTVMTISVFKHEMYLKRLGASQRSGNWRTSAKM